MLLEKQRDVLYFYLEISCHNEDGPKNLFNLNSLIDELAPTLLSKEFKKIGKNSNYAYRIKDYDYVSNEYVVFLISYSDANLPDPSFENIDSGELRTENKRKGEGIGYTAHVVVDLNPLPGTNKHICLIEHVTHCSRSAIQNFLDVQFRKFANNKFYTNSDGESVPSGPKIRIEVMDDTIAKDIDSGGEILKVTLVEDIRKGDKLDENQWVETKERQTVIRVKRNTALDTIKHWASTKKYQRLKIDYKTSKGKTKSASAREKEAALEFAFGKLEIIGLDNKLSSASDAINSELKEKMIALMKKQTQPEA